MIYTRELHIRRTSERESLRADAFKKAKEIAFLLKRKYKVKKVILFGSVYTRRFFHKRSDIDLLVEGIDASEFLRAGFDAWLLARPFDVDIIPLEKADPAIIAIAKENGIEL